MANNGPLGGDTNQPVIDEGTSCRHQSPRPGTLGNLLVNRSTLYMDDQTQFGIYIPFVNGLFLTIKNPIFYANCSGASSRVDDFSTQAGTITAIKNECISQGIVLKSQIAYIIATVDHETNHTFKPITEAYWLRNPDAYLRKTHADYYPYYGRGYVQLTWDYNYQNYGALLKRDLVNHPEYALEPKVALFILVHGFKNGTFTGKKLRII